MKFLCTRMDSHIRGWDRVKLLWKKRVKST